MCLSYIFLQILRTTENAVSVSNPRECFHKGDGLITNPPPLPCHPAETVGKGRDASLIETPTRTISDKVSRRKVSLA